VVGEGSTYGGHEKCTQDLVGRTDGKRPLGRPRRRWANNIEMDLHYVGRRGTDWIAMAHDGDRWRALVNAAMNPIKYGEFLD